jgi:transposase
MIYAGMDVHKATTYISVIDQQGQMIARKNLKSDEKDILAFLAELPERPKLVMESTSAWYWLYDALIAEGYQVLVSNPRQTKAIGSAKIKNDKIDAHMLAQLLRAGFINGSYVSDPLTREQKETLRHRGKLVRDATRHKNRIRNILAKNNVRLPLRSIFGPKGQELLKQVKLPHYHRQHLDTYLWLYNQLRSTIDALTHQVRMWSKKDRRAELLMTLPGVGPIVAMTILAEIGEISRFKTHRKLASYAGLVPCLDSTGGKHRLGRITKQGSPWLRTALVEAAQSVARVHQTKMLGIFFRKRIVKAGYRRAIVATARRILQMSFYILRDEVPYREQAQSAA